MALQLFLNYSSVPTKQNSFMLKIKQYQYYIFFFIIAALAFFQFTFFIHPPKYDIIDCYYPWRYFIGECLQNGKFPFWNPYQDLGYPIHADPSSGTWYPFVWIIGYFQGYDIYTIGFEIWIHVFIAGIGFYKLCQTLKTENSIAFMAGICYVLCGIFIGNAQHLTYVISACWIPFILNYYIKISESPSVYNTLKAGLFMFLLITGGYPAFTFILFYLVLILFIYFICKKIAGKNQYETFRFLLHNTLFFVVTIILSAGLLLSVYQVMPYLSRANNFDITRALFCPFSPQSSISFVLPFSVIKDIPFFNTDLSMSNAYFGIIFFLFFLFGLFIKKPALLKIFLLFGIFSLLAAFGDYLPVRAFLYKYVPFMNLFRFPSTFRLFTIIGFILTAAWWLNNFIIYDFEKRKTIIRGISLLIAGFVITVIVCRVNGYLALAQFAKSDLFIFSKTSTLTQHIAFQLIIQIGILLILLFIVWKVKTKKHFILSLTLLIFLDLFISAQLNAPYTAYSKEFSSKEVNKHIRKFPSGFPPLQDIAIADVKPNDVYFGPFWKNANIFQKQISAEGFNSFAFSSREYIRDEVPSLYEKLIKNKIVFLSDEVHSEKELDKYKKDRLFTSNSLFFNDRDLDDLKKHSFKKTSGDLTKLIYFKPDSFIIQTTSAESQLLTLLQNNYTGWQAFVNNNPTSIYTSNKTFMSVVVPEGNNTISFVYKNNTIFITALISTGALFLVLTLLIIQFGKDKFKNG